MRFPNLLVQNFVQQMICKYYLSFLQKSRVYVFDWVKAILGIASATPHPPSYTYFLHPFTHCFLLPFPNLGGGYFEDFTLWKCGRMAANKIPYNFDHGSVAMWPQLGVIGGH